MVSGPYAPIFPRALITCHTTNTNQMIIIGGVDPGNGSAFIADADGGDEPVDPWAQGIAVFDMTALRFKDSYEAQAKPYEPPDAIRRFYNAKSADFMTRFYSGIR